MPARGTRRRDRSPARRAGEAAHRHHPRASEAKQLEELRAGSATKPPPFANRPNTLCLSPSIRTSRTSSKTSPKRSKSLPRRPKSSRRASGLKNAAAAQRLAELRDRLTGGRKQLEQNALAPLDQLARVYPLMEDQARFVQLYLRQRDLAQRLTSFKGHDREDEPASKARMRDLEAEQKQIRSELGRLLDDIEEHAAAPARRSPARQAPRNSPGVRNRRSIQRSRRGDDRRRRGAGRLRRYSLVRRGHQGRRHPGKVPLPVLIKRRAYQAGQACLAFQPARPDDGQFDRTNARRRRVSVTRPDRQARLRHRRRHGQRL